MSSAEINELLTIGHSNHSWDDFVGLLSRHRVTLVADVRSQPVSRLPQFEFSQLAKMLPQSGFEYVFLGDQLGARRTEPECYEEESAIYERIAELPAFQHGLDRLLQSLKSHRLALMCSEKEPLDCHRAILVCRHLTAAVPRIEHILADGSTEDHGELERRLIEVTDGERGLFDSALTDSELLSLAYEKRGREIAYRRSVGATVK